MSSFHLFSNSLQYINLPKLAPYRDRKISMFNIIKLLFNFTVLDTADKHSFI